MDGKGAWRDNVFVERLWRTIKYEEVYLHAYESVSAARAGIGRYLDLYNRRRPHSSLDGMTPDRAYFANESTPPIRLAAYPIVGSDLCHCGPGSLLRIGVCRHGGQSTRRTAVR